MLHDMHDARVRTVALVIEADLGVNHVDGVLPGNGCQHLQGSNHRTYRGNLAPSSLHSRSGFFQFLNKRVDVLSNVFRCLESVARLPKQLEITLCDPLVTTGSQDHIGSEEKQINFLQH